MGLFNRASKKDKAALPAHFFEMLTGYSPVFTNAPESIYEMELIRTAIHSFATFCSKLKPEIRGTAFRHLERQLQFRINPYMDTAKFLYRIATILEVNNNAFIIPLENAAGEIVGFYPLLPQNCEIIEKNRMFYLRYMFSNGQQATIELERVGILTKHQYSDNFFGDSNSALRSTMDLIHTQNQGIINGVKNSASIRFLAKIANILKPEDIKAERERFTEDNLRADNKTGMIIYDNKFSDLKQVDSTPFTINAAQMKIINENVYNYFGTNEAILQNKYDEDGFDSYYEGKIEPFAVQLSLVISIMIHTDRELSHGNAFILTAKRLSYASNKTKLQLSTQLFDRGLLSRNGVMDIWGLPHVENGEMFYIRKEYAALEDLGKELDLKAKELAGSGITDPPPDDPDDKDDDEDGDPGTGGAHKKVKE